MGHQKASFPKTQQKQKRIFPRLLCPFFPTFTKHIFTIPLKTKSYSEYFLARKSGMKYICLQPSLHSQHSFSPDSRTYKLITSIETSSI